MARASNRGQILQEGLELVRRQGFGSAGVRSITTAAGVPQGSFSNHFASKEAFGLEVLDLYFAGIEVLIDNTLHDRDLAPLARLRAYFDAVTAHLESRGWRDGCLVGNLALEESEHSELLRTRLSEIFLAWRQPFADCLQEAADAGDVVLEVPAIELADFLLASWQGAILRMKIERSPHPLERFLTIVFLSILRRA